MTGRVAHWDDVEAVRRDVAPMSGAWRDLGRVAGSVAVGVKLIELAEGEMPTPPHVHGGEEEVFFVLRGSGLSWQDGKTYEIDAGDVLVHRAREEAHTLRGGVNGLAVLAFGERHLSGYGGYLPRSRAVRFWPVWVEGIDEDDETPWSREAQIGPVDFPRPERERPATIVEMNDVEQVERHRGDVHSVSRDLGRAAGSQTTGIKHVVVEAGALMAPPHCHAAEEELFVVLDGDGELELIPSPSRGAQATTFGERTTHALRAGSVVARPAGSGVAHAFRAGSTGMTVLAYGTREPNDVVYYPRSNKIYFRGIRLIGRVEPLDYWTGEDG